MLLVVDAADPGTLRVAAFWPVTGPTLPLCEVQARSCPVLDFVLRSRMQLLLGPHDNLAPARLIFELIGSDAHASMLLQPLISGECLVGMLVASRRMADPFTVEEHGTLAASLAVPLANQIGEISSGNAQVHEGMG